MFNKPDGKVGTREYACVIVLCVGIKFTGTPPIILFQIVKEKFIDVHNF
ncbi:MAG: hypothetical protein Q8936_08970 [Bacillota bacterium]|nr:hypothetical protein [Bacillota bacterium]